MASAGDAAVWRLLIDLARRQRGWTLVGARMVELHAFEHGRMPLRLSRDADALAEMDDLDAECWRSLPPDDAQRGLSAFRALTSLK